MEKKPDMKDFEADSVKTPEVKPASEAWKTDDTANAETELVYGSNCLICEKEVTSSNNRAIICSECKKELNLLIKNR